MFGNFSEDEVVNLYTSETKDLEVSSVELCMCAHANLLSHH